MVNLNALNIINNTSKDKINIKNDNNVSENKADFKKIINRVNNTVNKTDDRKETSKEPEKTSKNKIDSLTDKIKEVSKKIEDNEDVTEELTELLALLNYTVVDNTTLPIVIDEENLRSLHILEFVQSLGLTNDEEITITSVINNNLLNDLNQENNYDLNNVFKEIINKLDSDEMGMKEIFSTIDNSIENILPLLTTDKGNKVTMKNILSSIKDILSKDEIDSENNIVNNIITVNDNLQGENDLSSEFSYTDLLSDDESNEVISEEDAILSKLMVNEENDFSKAINNIQNRGKLTQSVVNEPVTVYKSNMENDIIKNVKFMIRNSVQELKVKIYPKELGEMTVKILSEEGIMRAEIKATSKETYNLLNSNINEIKKLLSNENIKIQDIQLGLYSEDTTFFSGENSKEHSREETLKSITNIKSIDDEITNEDINENINEDINVNLLV